MPIVSNYVQIVGDLPITIGDSQPVWEQNFITPGRYNSQTGLLLLNVSGLTYATAEVTVRLNNKVIGALQPYPWLDTATSDRVASHWYTQMIAFFSADLNDGVNELQINAVGFPGSSASNLFDDFQIKDVFCFYHVSV